jgi:hypothetical protein
VAQEDDLERVIDAFACVERNADGSRIAISKRSFFIIESLSTSGCESEPEARIRRIDHGGLLVFRASATAR